MKYLVIENSFDLAHGYKTRYQDFLFWIKQEINLHRTLPLKEQGGIDFSELNVSNAIFVDR